MRVLCGPVAVVYAAGLAAPFLAGDRFRAAPSAVPATWAVLMFPTLAARGGWAFLEWRFTGWRSARSRPTRRRSRSRPTG